MKGAILSKSGKYRYQLWRIWNPDKPLCLFIGLNPSTADSFDDDPTVKRLIYFAKKYGYGGFYIGNLYALRTSKPSVLFKSKKKIGKYNDEHLLEMYIKTKHIIIMWGSKKGIEKRVEAFFHMFKSTFLFYCFGHCKDGNPTHPLFLPKNTKLIKYNL